MALRIEYITFTNIGPFGKLQLKFPEKPVLGKAEIHILTGENGTGKSTVLEMMAACLKTKTPPEFLAKCRKTNESNTVQLGFHTGRRREIALKPKLIIAPISEVIQDFWAGFKIPNFSFPFAFFAYSGYR